MRWRRLPSQEGWQCVLKPSHGQYLITVYLNKKTNLTSATYEAAESIYPAKRTDFSWSFNTHLLTASTEPTMGTPPPSPLSYRTPQISNSTPFTLPTGLHHSAITRTEQAALWEMAFIGRRWLLKQSKDTRGRTTDARAPYVQATSQSPSQ